jgi:hypothetical protein
MIHERDRPLLGNDLPRLITHDPKVCFWQEIPCWKGNLKRQTMGQVSIPKFFHNYYKN